MNTDSRSFQSDAELPEGFKRTELGPLPEEWSVICIGEMFQIQQGKALSPKHRTGRGPKPFLRTANVYWGRIDLTNLDYMDFDDHEVERLALRPGDLLVCEGGDIGRTAMWEGQLPLCLYQNHLHRLRPIYSDVEPAFYMYWMQAAWTLLDLYSGAGNKTTIPNLSRSRLASFVIPLPPLPEQQAIARVLRTVQRAIEATERVIQATRELKKSLMHHLFTYGPVPVDQVDRVPLKETEIGPVPEHWEVVRLGEVWLKPQYGFTASATDQRVGPKFLRITDICDSQVNWSTVPYCKINDVLISKYQLEAGDLLFARIGATTGKSLLIRECPEAIFASYLIRVRLNLQRLLPEFLFHFTQGNLYWSQINSAKGGRLKQGINIPVLSSLLIPLPPLSEQRTIVHILTTADQKAEVEKRRKIALHALFQTLLHLIMTGKVRVKDLEVNEDVLGW